MDRTHCATVALPVAVEHYGSLAAVARALGLTRQAMSKRAREGRDLTLEECFLLHRDSGISLSRLRPDLEFL